MTSDEVRDALCKATGYDSHVTVIDAVVALVAEREQAATLAERERSGAAASDLYDFTAFLATEYQGPHSDDARAALQRHAAVIRDYRALAAPPQPERTP